MGLFRSSSPATEDHQLHDIQHTPTTSSPLQHRQDQDQIDSAHAHDQLGAANPGKTSSKPGKKDKVPFWQRPANNALKQQRLKAWQPILTPKSVIPTFFVVGILFCPIGGALLWGSNQVNELTIDYTGCEFSAPNTTFANVPSGDFMYSMSGYSAATPPPSWQFASNPTAANVSQRETCTLQFTIPSDLQPPVFLYYKMTNYFQNHRRYVRSYDVSQLNGDYKSASDLNNGNCKPVARNFDGGLPIYPCGLIANSLFNDTISSPVQLNAAGTTAGAVEYPMSEKGIAWPGDAKKYGKTAYTNANCIPPPFWALRYPNGYTDETPIPDLSQDEHFQVWMRTSGLPSFRKLWSRNDNDVLRAGRYQLSIFNNYPVAPYHGTKSIVISTVSFIGGRNPFLGISYIVVGAIALIIGVLLTARHLIRPRRMGDMAYLSWNRTKQD
ncbi:uncharacterized protein L969DRAFT_15324 [Mixia osmundae IAM 14324]|uniref:Cell cycle control protein n=1 Tax=Mixia osmundae (strain CBS 9802 / IAM 14324 / JCM 22182 / KY 12970) TaxID=764103 RepID=G7DXU4_MIXOS|nr:uncharacterized protein L969DRAFT_15324 [Mixia osmundae IAM 14324]KEI41307.1 hypothetical protein L969DRAFT_15324 [Mixia osmundae IAM 14324]GAA95404.1 hypothetical protein E5Q_02058 [Mixia osmundae IAM 14324]